MSREAGGAAEMLALAHLQHAGLRLVQTNYHCRYGEIDLIMQDGAAMVFVEVRQRSNHHAAATSIDAPKQRRLCAAAAHYLATLGSAPTCRFDAVLVDDAGCVRWIKGAFEAD